MRYLVLGSGLMGRAAAFDLLRHDDTRELILADIDESNLKSVADFLNDSRVKTVVLDAKDKAQVLEVMKGIDSVMACISYTLNYDLTKAAIKSGANFCDLGGNNTVVAKQFTLSKDAEKANVTVIPDCGFAPGVASIFVENGASKLDVVEEIHIRVGGLPQDPKPPLNYSLIFAVQGLTNEYIEIVEVIRDGKLTEVEPLTEIEEIEFPEPFGKLEAFQTSGGTSTLPKTFLGKVKELDYKTIRYKGHCEKMKAILDLGFKSYEKIDFQGCKISPREFLETMLVKNLTHENTKDLSLMRIEVIGFKGKKKMKISYQIIDYYDEENNLTSMMRMTSFPAAIIARMMAIGDVKKKGVVTQEYNVPSDLMLEELRKRNVNIEYKEEEIN
ncbi:MAG: saccharopine dehydrogenase [Candidatus Heimdallarchaeota archaeon]|nr:saccharopine dehydrogenase [Candidatus Heimdallarchaeota archaeon]MCG3252408.1 saccharopine dehydrogenase NADP-binding domain-containing protein [Candidatus Heimdallarchaeota archaeon]MCK4289546.1 saccharopine dehydrogenase NADP-binding domain-containing protein [Candidatus Heimdallarchaeota archaeon]